MQYHANTYEEDEWDVYWFEKNLLGDIIAIYASDGTKLIEYHYDAWGTFGTSYKNGGQNTTATKNSFGYLGYYYDKDLEMYYLASRYYDAKICRFISPDSFVSTGVGLIGHNMYAYCNNSPVSMIDPLGNAPITIGVGIVIAVLAIGTVGSAILGLLLDEKIIDNKDNVDGMVSLPESHPNTDGNNYNSSELPSEFSNETNGSLAPPNTGDYELTLEDRVINSAIMASYGLAASGAVLIIGAIILPAKAFVGITAIQVFAIGCLAYNVSAMITAPLIGIEMEPLEMN